MTALMEGPTELTTSAATPESELAELHAMLVAQSRRLATQGRMLEALNERREQLDELIVDTMPVVNAMLLMSARTLGPLASADAATQLKTIAKEIDDVRRAPAPGLLALLARLRDPDVRKAIALAIATLGAVGRAAATEREVAGAAPPNQQI